jgi:predicted flap endonuclease-1-like 5' DNA nuclease
MPTPSLTAALISCAGALALGLIVGWVYFRLRTAARFVPLAAHRDELVALRRRYRRRLRAMRDAATRYRIRENELREGLRVATAHEATRAKLAAAADAEITTLRARLAELARDVGERGELLAAARGREEALAAELRAALERSTTLERSHGLMQIERDELVARTARVRALPSPERPPESAAQRAAPAAPRAELADRDARIHELECQLRESAGRVGELESSLRTWKYRIAPLALHLERRRDRAAASAPAAPARDDLKRIRGIGRGLEKKLHAQGVTGYAELAAMSPAELANLATRLGVAASRPHRDRWAEQAHELATAAGRASRRDGADRAGTG